MRRVVLFLLTNFAILFVLSISARIFGIDRFLTGHGLNMGMLLTFCLGLFSVFVKDLHSRQYRTRRNHRHRFMAGVQ